MKTDFKAKVLSQQTTNAGVWKAASDWWLCESYEVSLADKGRR